MNNATNNHLYQCPNIQHGLYTCRQTSNKKILLSLGGATAEYQLTGATDGTNFASTPWGLFVPRITNLGQRRQAAPLRLHYNGVSFSVDGFDLDLHRAPAHRQLGRIHRADEPTTRQLRLRGRPDALRRRVAAMRRPGHKPHRRPATQHRRRAVHPILAAYNTPQCSAAANPDYLAGGPSNTSGFTWTLWLGGTASKNARLFVGLPGEFRRRM